MYSARADPGKVSVALLAALAVALIVATAIWQWRAVTGLQGELRQLVRETTSGPVVAAEAELLRFERAIAELRNEPGESSRELAQLALDTLKNRLALMQSSTGTFNDYLRRHPTARIPELRRKFSHHVLWRVHILPTPRRPRPRP